ncbi:hypothetical protein A2U01_0077223, partial [Trifolium medium]|nr:hypothetical protein [Trifolium medium]
MASSPASTETPIANQIDAAITDLPST